MSAGTLLRTLRAVLARSTVIFLLCLLAAVPAAAEEVSCPKGNLLSGARPSESQGVTSVARLTDGVMAAEGDLWNTELTSVLSSPQSQVVYDLGGSVAVSAVDLQGDNNDVYILELSEDGTTFSELWVGNPVSGQGMRRRGVRSTAGEGRYLRLRAQGGDGYYSVSELQVFCQKPTAWPPPVEVKAAASWWWKNILKKRDNRYRLGLAFLGLLFFIALFRADRSRLARTAAVVLALAMLGVASYRFHQARHAPWFASWGVYVLGAAVLAWAGRAVWLVRQKGNAAQWLERGALVWVILAASAAWVNFGVYHTSRIVHYWDTFHYYIGSKYFKENEYERLYECVLAADFQDRGESDFRRRKVRDLIDNRLHYVSIDDIHRYEKSCLSHFSPERWEAFKQDARSFRTVMGSSWWKDMVMDHGYNASPVSNIVASTLTNIRWRAQVPENPTVQVQPDVMKKFRKRILRYAMIDLMLYAGAFLMILWAFGLRACALSVLVWGAGYPWGYFWTGGSFARVPWFFMAVAAVCLLKRGLPLLSGFALSWSALLRLFPAAMAGGPGAAIVDRFVRRRKLDEPWLRTEDKRFIVGGVLGLVVLLGSSLAVNGVDVHTQFLGNTLKHAETPLTNHMGLPTMLSYQPSKVGRYTKDPSLDDPWAKWKQARKEAKHDRRWLHALTLLGMFVLLALAGRRMAAWAVLASSTILIIGFFELTCYYYSFAVLMAPLAIERLRYAVALIAMVMVGLILQFFIGWYDEQYLWETVAVLLTLLYIIIDVVRHPLPESSPAAAAPSS